MPTHFTPIRWAGHVAGGTLLRCAPARDNRITMSPALLQADNLITVAANVLDRAKASGQPLSINSIFGALSGEGILRAPQTEGLIDRQPKDIDVRTLSGILRRRAKIEQLVQADMFEFLDKKDQKALQISQAIEAIRAVGDARTANNTERIIEKLKTLRWATFSAIVECVKDITPNCNNANIYICGVQRNKLAGSSSLFMAKELMPLDAYIIAEQVYRSLALYLQLPAKQQDYAPLFPRNYSANPLGALQNEIFAIARGRITPFGLDEFLFKMAQFGRNDLEGHYDASGSKPVIKSAKYRDDEKYLYNLTSMLDCPPFVNAFVEKMLWQTASGEQKIGEVVQCFDELNVFQNILRNLTEQALIRIMVNLDMTEYARILELIRVFEHIRSLAPQTAHSEKPESFQLSDPEWLRQEQIFHVGQHDALLIERPNAFREEMEQQMTQLERDKQSFLETERATCTALAASINFEAFASFGPIESASLFPHYADLSGFVAKSLFTAAQLETIGWIFEDCSRDMLAIRNGISVEQISALDLSPEQIKVLQRQRTGNLRAVFVDIEAPQLVFRPEMTLAKIRSLLPGGGPDELLDILQQSAYGRFCRKTERIISGFEDMNCLDMLEDYQLAKAMAQKATAALQEVQQSLSSWIMSYIEAQLAALETELRVLAETDAAQLRTLFGGEAFEKSKQFEQASLVVNKIARTLPNLAQLNAPEGRLEKTRFTNPEFQTIKHLFERPNGNVLVFKAGVSYDMVDALDIPQDKKAVVLLATPLGRKAKSISDKAAAALTTAAKRINQKLQ